MDPMEAMRSIAMEERWIPVALLAAPAGGNPRISPGTPGQSVSATIERVIDGDTVEALVTGEDGKQVRQRVRLLGIDSPERGTEPLLDPLATDALPSHRHRGQASDAGRSRGGRLRGASWRGYTREARDGTPATRSCPPTRPPRGPAASRICARGRTLRPPAWRTTPPWGWSPAFPACRACGPA